MTAKLSATGLVKTYGSDRLAEPVLRGVSIDLHGGETCLLMGPSGSGKTTLLSHLGCLLTPTWGTLKLAGKLVDFSRADALAEARRKSLGFVFQHAQLLPFLTVEENLVLVARNAGLRREQISKRLEELHSRLEMGQHRKRLPGELSGGERQRVAIARALVHSPGVVLADEPTAALDWKIGRQVVDLLVEQVRDSGAALLVVTHDHRLIPMFDRLFRIESGRLYEDREAKA